MRYVALALAGGAMITGFIAAWYWYKASVVKLAPETGGGFGGGFASVDGAWAGGAVDAIKESSRLNKIAAGFTAASVALSGLSSMTAQC
jgi:hypothetical protein